MPLFRINDRIVFFVHIPKTGGTSVERFLAAYGPMCLHSSHPLSLPCSPQHFHADLYRHFIPDAFADYAFAIVRNPFDRAISEYVWFIKRFRSGLSFDDWVSHCHSQLRQNPYLHDNHMRPQVEFLTERTKTFHFEDGLEDILSKVCSEIGIDKDSRVPHVLKSEPTELSMSRQSLNLLQSLYAKDFARFGYDPDPAEVLARRKVFYSGRLYSAGYAKPSLFKRVRRGIKRLLLGRWSGFR